MIFPEVRDADNDKIWGSAWDNEASAKESCRLNATEHGHLGATLGPLHTEIGWITGVDLRGAISRNGGRDAHI